MWMHTCSWPSCLVETKKDLARHREEGRAKKSMCKVLDLKEHQDSWGQEKEVTVSRAEGERG